MVAGEPGGKIAPTDVMVLFDRARSLFTHWIGFSDAMVVCKIPLLE
jgi:hypothetical protein